MPTVEEWLRRLDRAKSDRSRWDEHWDDLAAVMLPRRLGFATTLVSGEQRTEHLYDNTPMRAARGLANAIGSLLRPEGQQWFFLKADEEGLEDDDEASMWLRDAEVRLMKAFANPKARFRQASGEADTDLAVLGTAAMFVGESRDLTHLMFKALHLKDCWVLFDADGAPDTMFREEKLTARQAAQRFGEEKLGKDARRALSQKHADKKFCYVQIVTPREGNTSRFRLPFQSVWIEKESKHEIDANTAGYHEFPFVVPRWDTTAGEEYGRSPGMIALPDSNTLQAMGETILIAGQRSADPPLFAPSDGAFSTFNTFPGGVSYYDAELARDMGRSPVFPLETGGQLAISRDMQGDTREQVMAAFFKNILNLPVDGPDMTATEVIERKEEFIREIGAVFGRLETDYTGPMVERAFNVMLRRGGFAPIPEALQGRNVAFEYESPVKRVRQQVERVAARQWVLETLEVAAANPEAADRIDFDEYIRFQREAGGVPQNLEATDEMVAQRRQARQQAQQAEEQAQTVERGAAVAKDVAPLMQDAG